MHNSEGARTVYLLGYNEGVHFVRDIATEARARGIVDSFEFEDYLVIVAEGVSKHRLARMTMTTRCWIQVLGGTQEPGRVA